jgi:hypothetical protein
VSTRNSRGRRWRDSELWGDLLVAAIMGAILTVILFKGFSWLGI